MSHYSEQSATQDLMSGASWENFCDRLKAIGSEVLRDDVPGDEQSRAEGYRHLTRALACSLQQIIEYSDTARPSLHPNPSAAMRWGGDNPDNLYQHAAIDGGRTYRVKGTRGTVVDFILSASAAGPMEAPATKERTQKKNQVFHELTSGDLEIAEDGTFELVISPHEHQGNWLKTSAETGFLTIRQYFLDWDVEQAAEFYISCDEGNGTAPEPVTAQWMASRLDDVMTWVERRPYWTRMIKSGADMMPANSIHLLDSVKGGSAEICYGIGYFELEEDECLLFEVKVPEARYWQIALINFWMESLDYGNHQSSLNKAQAFVDDDGVFRAVISRSDPGVPNWLDTVGHHWGHIQFRWIWFEDKPNPTVKLLKRDELRLYLPADHPVTSEQERRAVVARRQRHLVRRYRTY